MLSFESVKQRLARESPLSFLEFNYMILQADGSSSSATATTIAATPPPPPVRTTPTATTPLPTRPTTFSSFTGGTARRCSSEAPTSGETSCRRHSETCPRLVRRLRPVGKHHLWRRARVAVDGARLLAGASRTLLGPSPQAEGGRRAALRPHCTARHDGAAAKRQRGRGGPSADVCGRSPV